MTALQVMLRIFTMEPYQCVPALCSPDSLPVVCLSSLISEEFLEALRDSPTPAIDQKEFATDILTIVSQMLCFPFAIDTHNTMLSAAIATMEHCYVVIKLVIGVLKYISQSEKLEVVMGLISRLVLCSDDFVEQFVFAEVSTGHAFLSKMLSADNYEEIQSDAVSILTQLARSSEKHLAMLRKMLGGENDDFKLLKALLSTTNVVVVARTCGMLGNLLRHSDLFYSVLKTKPEVMRELLTCLSNDDADVRKAATFAVGNAAYHSGDLYSQLVPAIPPLVQLLSDSMMRTRTNAAGALGNLTRHNHKLSAQLIKASAPELLLEVASHDSQYVVQEVALVALRTMCKHANLKQVLLKHKALDKLSALIHGIQSSDISTPRVRPSSTASRNTAESVLHHALRLQTALKRTGSAR